VIAIIFAAATGFINLPRLVAAHPLAPVLAQYDREIAALRSTERVPGLTAIARSTVNDARTIRSQTATASAQAQNAGASSSDYAQREATILQRLAGDGAASAAAYGASARDAAAATLQSYRAAMAQRTARALAARRQQLSEAEATLAFDLEKRDAGKRLTLQLRLQDLHLSTMQRAQLRAQRNALDAGEAAAVDALRRKDAATLDEYSVTLRAQETDDDVRMATEVARTTVANVAARRRMSSAAPDIQALRGYRLSSDAADIEGGFADAGRDLTQRFDALQNVDRSSRTATDARIAQIEANRSALFNTIVAQITSDARAAARQRHLGDVLVGTTQPRDAVDLTAQVRAKLAAGD
jgi:hypothetical protein